MLAIFEVQGEVIVKHPNIEYLWKALDVLYTGHIHLKLLHVRVHLKEN